MHRSKPDLDIVVPVYNEEFRLPATLRALMAHTATLPLGVRITVVDNGSVDRTTEVLDEVAQGRPDNTSLRVIGCSRQGKGAAVRRGLLASSARWRGFCDADLSTPPQTLTDVVSCLERGPPGRHRFAAGPWGELRGAPAAASGAWDRRPSAR